MQGVVAVSLVDCLTMSTPASMTHTVGTLVWVADKVETWIKGEVVQAMGDKIQVKTEDGQLVEAKPDDCPL